MASVLGLIRASSRIPKGVQLRAFAKKEAKESFSITEEALMKHQARVINFGSLEENPTAAAEMQVRSMDSKTRPQVLRPDSILSFRGKEGHEVLTRGRGYSSKELHYLADIYRNQVRLSSYNLMERSWISFILPCLISRRALTC
jgi:hypothetical protein